MEKASIFKNSKTFFDLQLVVHTTMNRVWMIQVRVPILDNLLQVKKKKNSQIPISYYIRF